MKPIARPKRNPLQIPSHPQSPSNGALFVFAIRPSQQIATPAPAESPVPTDVTGNRLTAPAHTETRPAPSKGTDRYNLKRASFVSMMRIRAVVRLALFHGPRTDARCSHR